MHFWRSTEVYSFLLWVGKSILLVLIKVYVTWNRLWISSNSSSVIPSSSWNQTFKHPREVQRPKYCRLLKSLDLSFLYQINSENQVNLFTMFSHSFLNVRLLIPSKEQYWIKSGGEGWRTISHYLGLPPCNISIIIGSWEQSDCNKISFLRVLI